MRKLLKLGIGGLLVPIILVMGVAGGVLAEEDPLPMDIVVSPNVLCLGLNGGSVSIHTNLDYISANNARVVVNDEEISSDYFFTKADLRGDLVVKININAIKGEDVVKGSEEMTFELWADDSSGVTHYGTDTIRVVSGEPQGKQ